MRKALRIVFALLLAYLVQATILPYFRINSIIIDVITVVLYTTGFACGLYAGFVTGLLGALLQEVLSGDLPGLTALIAIAAGWVGAYVARFTRLYERNDNKRVERLVKRVTPILAVGMLVLVREGVFILYFYLTGTEMKLMHFLRALQCCLITMACASVLMPFVSGFILRERENTFLAKRLRKRKNKKVAKPLGLTIKLPEDGSRDVSAMLSKQFHVEIPFDGGEDTIDEPATDFIKPIAIVPIAIEPIAIEDASDEGGTEA